MLAVDEDDKFCKTTLSAMILNYPPPTIINLHERLDDIIESEKARLTGVLRYLGDEKKIRDDDLVLIVDGRDTWFQLPSDVIIRQYQHVLEDADNRLARKYRSNYTQTIVFGAVKECEGDDAACEYFPPSMLPHDVYGKETGGEAQWTPANYLDSSMLMGPAKDLRALYEAAVQVFEEKKSHQPSVQSVMATIFGQQQMARYSQQKNSRSMKSMPSKWLDYFGGSPPEAERYGHEKSSSAAPSQESQYEFKIGLDYTHTIFQPLKDCAPHELISISHDNSTDLSKFHHPGTPSPPLTIPIELEQARPPFWTPDLYAHNPSPNDEPAYIDRLVINNELDRLKPRQTTWDQIRLVQNTYTGAVPAIFHVNNRSSSNMFWTKRQMQRRPIASITWKSMWYATYERALLRNYFRNPQSPIGYHTAAIGGDRLWDVRGGRGGVWTEKEALWLPWGEVDGVCGSVRQMRETFEDGKGVWLHELDEGMGEPGRNIEEVELQQKILAKEQEAAEKEEEKLREEQSLKKEQDNKVIETQDELRHLIDTLKLKGVERMKLEGWGKKSEEAAQRYSAEQEKVAKVEQQLNQKDSTENPDPLTYENQVNGEKLEKINS